MKIRLMQLAAVTFVSIVSSVALAGDNCPSKGAHKDMSAAMSQDGKDVHTWIQSQDVEKDESAPAAKTQAPPVEAAPQATTALKI